MRPDQRQSRRSPTEPIFVGIAGHIGAGKTSAAKYLRDKWGFQYLRYSQVLRDWLASGSADRDRLRALGWDVMAGGQQAELNRRLLAGLDRTRNAAIDGLRHQIDFDSLSTILGPPFRLVFLDAAPAVRFERLRSRFDSEAKFRAADSAAVESHTEGLRSLASAVISNEESLEALHCLIDDWVGVAGIGERT